MKKRIVGTLMALLLAVTVLPPGAISVTSADVTTGLVTTAYAAEHQNHCICGAEHKSIGDHTQDATPETWTGVSSLSEIQEDGYYYLTKDVELSSAWSANYRHNGGTGYDNNVVLCLNGHSIGQSRSDAVISVSRGCTITITDCAAEGKQGEIKHVEDKVNDNKIHFNHGVYVTYGTFNMYGGRITGNTTGYDSPGKGSGVYVGDGYSSSSNAVFNMYGGTITGNTADKGGAGGGVYVESGRTFNMYGGAISNNSATEGGGVYVTSNATFTMSGGTIGENTASNKGGGVFVESGATFTMSGDANITANTAGTTTYGFGGGVYSKGTFNLSGGAITQNTANCAGFTNKLGGGVMAAGGKLNLSGNPVVKNNTGKDTDNVRVSGSTIAVTDALTEGAEIVLNSLNGATITGDSAYYTRTDKNDGSVALTAPTGSSGGETGGETTEHKHCVCGSGTLSAAGHTHDASVTWIGVAALSEITTAGNYYLKKDITLENTWNVPAAGVVLCLNGKTVTAKQTGIIVPANSTLTLTDCKPDGKDGCISGNKWRGIEINGGGSLTIYAGKIEKFNTGLELSKGGTLTMYGGTIADNLASGVVVQDGGNAVISGGTVTGNSTGVTLGGTLTVDGNAVITGNSYAGIDDYGTLTIGGNANITENGGSWGKINVNLASLEGKEPVPITVRNDFNGKFGLTTSLGEGAKVINGTVKGTITCDSSRKTIDADGKIQQATSVPVEGVALNKQGLSLTEGGTETLTATITPANATNKNVTWSSSNTAVATVENGVVTAVSVGTATITVTTEDGGKATCCEVTVTAAQTGHVHVKGERTYDENGHWFKCTGCNEKLEYAVHQLDADGKCECGYVKQGNTPTPTPEAPRYYYSSGSGSTGAGGLSAVQNDPNGKSATDYNGGIYGLIFKSYANFSSFQGVQVDGKTIAPANYIAEEGSIEVYLKAVYLRTLAAGKHTVTILSSEGNATAEFTVGGVVSAPKTADAGALAYLGLALSSYVGTALVTRRKKEF